MPQSTIPDAAGETPEHLTATMMAGVLRVMVFFVGIEAGVVLPFLSPNKRASFYLVAFSAVTMLVIPWLLLRKRRAVLAASVFLVGGALVGMMLGLLGSGGVNSIGTTIQLAIVGIAIVVLGRRPALWLMLLCLVDDLASASADLLGHPLPVVFHGTPLSIWFSAVVFFVLMANPMNRAMRVLQDLLGQRARAQERISYQAQLIEQSGEPVMAADKDLVVRYWNPAASRVFGWSPEEAVGRPLAEVTPYVPTGLSPEHLREELARTGHYEGEISMLTRAGSTVIIDASFNVLRNAAGEPVGTVGGMRNISLRREAEEALKRSEERLRLIADTAPIGIVVFDAAGKVVFANPFATRVMGCELVGLRYDQPEWEFTDLDGNPLPSEERPFLKVLNTRRPLVATRYAVRPAGGQRVYLSASAAPIRGAGEELEGVVSVIEDITERRELEERYLQVQKMQSLGRLAAGVAHDFNNLLTVINGYSRILLDDMKPDNTQQRAHLENILKSGEKAAELTGQLLAFSRQQTLRRKVIDLNVLIDELRPMLMRVVTENIDLQFAFGANRAPVFANPHQIEQVIMNLVVNASDAMPRGGSLRVKTANVAWDQEYVRVHPEAHPGRYVELTVTDTGTGMDEKTLRNMFEPFFTTKDVGKGTGLGLSTVQGIVEQAGGYIAAQSALGHGTTFRIYLPEKEAAPDSTPAPTHEQATAPVSDRRKSVLVVEDQPNVRQYVTLVLESQGYQVTAADSSEAAIAIFEKSTASVDLILTDVVMPGMSGRELVGRLMHLQPGVKVLFMSGYTDGHIGAHNISSQDMDIIMKPFSPDQLGAKVRDALAH
jgi:two-component system, cell cycle sensor histidine kinase and response regulator CckA